MNATAYLRVSTDEQASSGLGLDAQRAAIEDAARRQGLTVTAWHTDAGLSGSLPPEERPGLTAALGSLAKGSVLLVAKRDRLARDVLVMCLLERDLARRGCRIVSAAGEGTETEGPAGFLQRTMLDGIAQYERLLIASRTKSALGAKRHAGEKTGGHVPYGYRIAGHRIRGGKSVPVLETDPAEQSVIERICRLWRAGHTVRWIARELDAAGVASRSGKPWAHQLVAKIVQRANLPAAVAAA
jgi:DNA invertase Pin-like site-specific DNA recombinase